MLLVNAQHVKAVPGRKTDVKDAEWIADLLQHGLLRASFIPPRPQRELRELTRYRASLVGERARLVNRIQKVLEDANIKLASVVTDVTGVSGRAILGALLQGQQDPETLAELARGRLRGKREPLAQAVQGTLRQHHRFLLTKQLSHLDALDKQIADFDREISDRLGIDQQPTASEGSASQETAGEPEPSTQEHPQQISEVAEHVPHQLLPTASEGSAGRETAGEPEPSTQEQQTTALLSQEDEGYAQAITLLDAVTGINQRIAQIIVAEIGIDMSRFPSEAHLASWVGLCPGTKISAGKRLSGKTQKGNQWLRQALIEAAHGAARSKGTYLGALSQRRCKRLGSKKAIVALAHRILVIVYHLLKDKTPYQERGEAYVQQQEHETMKLQAVRRLQRLGYEVSLEALEVA